MNAAIDPPARKIRGLLSKAVKLRAGTYPPTLLGVGGLNASPGSLERLVWASGERLLNGFFAAAFLAASVRRPAWLPRFMT